MAGSRIEKIGSIYTRVCGLLRAKAIKDVDKPLWFDVYEKFPPKEQPVYERQMPEGDVPTILYKEDIIRAKFFETYGSIGYTDFADEHHKSISERFVERYQELQARGVEESKVFSSTCDSLKAEGVRLKTTEDLQRKPGKIVVKQTPTQQTSLSAANLLGLKDTEDLDYIPDEK